MSRKLAMDGTRYTYVKRRGGRRKLKWTFWLSRNKALELRAFIFAYFASKVQATDHSGRVWAGNFTNNPFEFDTPDAAQPAIAPMPRGELQAIDIEFEESWPAAEVATPLSRPPRRAWAAPQDATSRC